MWKKLLGTTLIAAFALSSCTDKDVYQGPKEDEKEFNTFPFSTVQKDVNLNVNYVNGAVQSNVYFEVYDEMPVAESEYGTYTKRQDVITCLLPIPKKTVLTKVNWNCLHT